MGAAVLEKLNDFCKIAQIYSDGLYARAKVSKARLLFFRHIPLSATLYKILVMDFHTWWHYHYFCFTGTAQQSTLSTYFVFGELSDDC